MIKFEYMSEKSWNKARLNELGADGWEVILFDSSDRVWLKKEIKIVG